MKNKITYSPKTDCPASEILEIPRGFRPEIFLCFRFYNKISLYD